MSALRFCGMMEEPVVKASEMLINCNSQLAQRISSSAMRERCIINMEISPISSTAKSRSETPSMLFRHISSNPSSSASMRLSVS